MHSGKEKVYFILWEQLVKFRGLQGFYVCLFFNPLPLLCPSKKGKAACESDGTKFR